MKPKLFFLFITCIFYVGAYCAQSSSNRGVAGTYRHEYYGVSELILRKNGQYLYNIEASMIRYRETGTWKSKDSALFLEPRIYHSFYKFTVCDNCKSNYLSIYDAETMKIEGGYFKAYRFGKKIREGLADSMTILPKGASCLKVFSLMHDSISFNLDSTRKHLIKVYLAKERFHNSRNYNILIDKDTLIFDNYTKFVRVGAMDEERPLYGAEKMPQFPGGEEKMNKFITDNIHYPANYVKPAGLGIVVVRFVVKKDGQITNIEVKRGINDAINEEVVRVIKLMPKWIPAYSNGKRVSVYLTQPFSL